jgi:hypothetical protein
MLRSNAILAILAICFQLLSFQAVTAHRIDISPGSKECYFEDLHVEDQVSDERLDVIARAGQVS